MPHVFVDGEFVGLLPGEFPIDLWENYTTIEIGVPEIRDRPLYRISLFIRICAFHLGLDRNSA